VIVYILLAIALFAYATNCTGTFCGLVALLVGMLWLLFLDFVGGDSYHSGIFGWIAIGLNIVILDFIFATLQKRALKNSH